MKQYMLDKHGQFQGKINNDTLDILNELYKVTNGNLEILSENTQENVFKKLDLNKLQFRDLKLKASIYYQKYCILIEKLLKEYEDLNMDERKEIIDYYLFDNRLKELNCIGLSYYYDCKFKKSKATIYKGRYKQVNWNEVRNKDSGKYGDEAVKAIIRSCREHINTGGEVELRSYSKCFGIDLFKYISLYKRENGSNVADIYIKREADINIIKTPKGIFSIQSFIKNNVSINEVDFAIDFSEARDSKRENFENWYRNFMNEELKNKLKIAEDIINNGDWDSRNILLYLLNDNKRDTQISKMVSPLADKEVVVSGDIWGNPIDYDKGKVIYTNNSVSGYDDGGKCVHFSLEEDELVKLIYHYYKEYVHNKYEIEESRFLAELCEVVEKIINIINKEKDNNEKINEESTNKWFEFLEKKINEMKDMIKETSTKIETILNLVDWSNESINEHWSYENIYNKDKENYFVNIFKWIITDTYKNCKGER